MKPERFNGDNDKTIRILSFHLCQYRFGFDVRQLVAVTRMLKITPIAQTADFFEGIINLYGHVTPVIDLTSLFELKPDPQSKKDYLIALKGDQFNLCVSVNQLAGFVDIGKQKTDTLPDVFFSDYLTSVYKSNGELVMILTPDKFFDTEEMKVILQSEKSKKLLSKKADKNTKSKPTKKQKI